MLTEAVHNRRDAVIGRERERKQEAETRGQADKSPREYKKIQKERTRTSRTKE